MANRLENFILNKISKRQLIVLFSLVLLFLIVMNAIIFPRITTTTNGIKVFDLQWFIGYRYKTAHEFLTTISPQGRNVYLHCQLPLDFIFVLTYSSSLLFALVKIFDKLNYFTALPILIMFIDISENICIYLMLTKSSVSHTLVAVSSTLTILKSVLIVVVCTIGIIHIYNVVNKSDKKLTEYLLQS